MKDKEIIEELKNIGEENFTSFSPEMIKTINDNLKEIERQIYETTMLKKEDIEKEQH